MDGMNKNQEERPGRFSALLPVSLAGNSLTNSASDVNRTRLKYVIQRILCWTAATAVVMFALVADEARTGAALGDPVLSTEGKVALIDGIVATAVPLGLCSPPPRAIWRSTAGMPFGQRSGLAPPGRGQRGGSPSAPGGHDGIRAQPGHHRS